MRLLIVEDEMRIRNGLVHLLSNINPSYQVVASAENGYEGILCARDFEPDVVISDIKMPKMDGLKMIEGIQALNLHPEFILLSGYAEFEYARKAIRLGITEYLLKPISVDALTETLYRIEKNLSAGTTAEPAQEEPAYSAVVADMTKTIHSQYGRLLRLDLFAEKYKMTPEYLSTMFTRETHMTFSNYLKSVRIEQAKLLLKNSDLKVYEVACRVGYPEQKYFSKVFHESVGVSAKQYASQKKKV